MKHLIFLILPISLLSILSSCLTNSNTIKLSENSKHITFENRDIKLEFDDQMMINVFRKSENKSFSIIKKGQDPYSIIVNGSELKKFKIDRSLTKISILENNFGDGKLLTLSGTVNGPLGAVIEKKIHITMYEKLPTVALISVDYRNVNMTSDLQLEKEISNRFDLDASLVNPKLDKHDFWILQGGSYLSRPDWILPVGENFNFKNYQGIDIETRNVGGGLPVVDVWNKETGFFIGSANPTPTQISLPAITDSSGFLNVSMEYEKNILFTETYQTDPLIIGVHQGDYYNGISSYARAMEINGLVMPKADLSSSAYKTTWCAWGFGPEFTTDELLATVPQLKELNIKLVTVDYGWFENYGDFSIPKSSIFPEGDKSIKKLADDFHDQGFLIKLWVTPGVAGPDLIKRHPEWMIQDVEGNILPLTSFIKDSGAFLCPAIPEVQEYQRSLVKKWIRDWNFDGLKMDFSIINAFSNCYAKNHDHDSPQVSAEELPDLFKIIEEESKKIKPNVLLEVCPCGRFPSFYKMAFYNQPVTSDQNSDWQIRHRVKTFKALMGPQTAVYGDHVERYYKEANFACMIGTGAVPGTMFVEHKKDQHPHKSLSIALGTYLGERKETFKKWHDIYNRYELSKGEYQNLYDIAYDKPEAHTIKKENILYYAFYADEWDGDIQFRGLDDREYLIFDYVNEKEIGKINGNSTLNIQFNEYLLVKAVPVKS